MKAFSNLSKDIKTVILIVFSGLFIRLIALPFSVTVESDAVNRVNIAWHWLEEPHFITHGVWGPLHTYLIAAGIWLIKDPVLSPKLLNIFFSVATAVVLYFFTKNEFSERASWFVCYTFLFYPVGFRNSLQALSDTPFVFFVALSLLFLSKARQKDGSGKHALIAGLSLTLASMLRYEGWVLIPLLSVLLWKKPKSLLAFFLVSMIFPTFWMVGNHIHYGDALYSTNYQQEVELTLNRDMTQEEIIQRILYFPLVLFFGMTIPVFLCSLLGITLSLVNRKSNFVWLIPFSGLFTIFFLKSLTGSLALQTRYSLLLGMFLLVFSAEAFNKIPSKQLRISMGTIIIFLMIPLSYIKDNAYVPGFLSKIIPKDIEAIPRASKYVEGISLSTNEKLDTRNDSIIVVNFGIGIGHQIAFRTHISPPKQLVIPYGFQQESDWKNLEKFFDNHKKGIIVLKAGSHSISSIHLIEKIQLKINSVNNLVALNLLEDTSHALIYHYQIINENKGD
ncbi:MAG: DUF2079 domain-containing protein [Okeania sp. SIO1H6]|nr:DUF2079 domain-containing protein [Okeania sp. SIO1H6]